MSTDRDRLIDLLAELAYRETDVVLSSGRESGVYLDAKRVTYHPDGVQLVGSSVLDRIGERDVAAVGGPTMGADAIVASTIWASKLAGRPLPGFIVRNEAKRHGLQRMIEGVAPEPGTRVAVVEDVVTTGGSVLRAIDAVEEAGLDVVVVVPLVDREEGGADAIRARGIEVRPVCTLAEVEVAVRRRSASQASGT